MGYLNGSGMDRRFFHRLGASRLDRTICAAAGAAALVASLGARLGTEPEQFAHSKLIIAWGANILGTNVALVAVYRGGTPERREVVRDRPSQESHRQAR